MRNKNCTSRHRTSKTETSETQTPETPTKNGIFSWIKPAIQGDSKTIWAVVFLLGSVLGYNVPVDFNWPDFPENEFKKQVEDNTFRIEALEAILNEPEVSINFEEYSDKLIRPRRLVEQ